MWLRAGLPLLWRGTTEAQVGTDPRWAVVLTDLSPSAARAVGGLPPGTDAEALAAALTAEGVTGAETQAVLDHLATAGLLVHAPPSTGSPDAAAWSLLHPDGDGSVVMARRRACVVRVLGLDRVGVAIASTIAAAGIGTIELVDPRVVTRHEVGVGGYTTGHVGMTRTDAAARVVHDVAPTTRTRAPRRTAPHLVVLVERGVADPVVHAGLLRDDVPHLSVVLREASALVGPLVLPGRSACLRCVDLHRTDRDPGWPVVAAQLAAQAEAPRTEVTLAAGVAAWAATQVVAHVDGRPTAVADALWEMRLPDLVQRRSSLPVHARCGCTGLPASDDRPHA